MDFSRTHWIYFGCFSFSTQNLGEKGPDRKKIFIFLVHSHWIHLGCFSKDTIRCRIEGKNLRFGKNCWNVRNRFQKSKIGQQVYIYGENFFKSHKRYMEAKVTIEFYGFRYLFIFSNRKKNFLRFQIFFLNFGLRHTGCYKFNKNRCKGN